MPQKYPIGLQSFQKIREGGYIYIDKTKIIHQLVESGKYYFLSRPRRFGKSLLLDTIEELFKGSKGLFEGLWIHNQWDWTKTNPVIHISFASLPYEAEGLSQAITYGLKRKAQRLGIHLSDTSYDQQFKELIEKAALNSKVVILIDEYDKPVIDFLEDPDQMETNRQVMTNFYSILNESDKYIRFLLITGVSQINVFSKLNNLRDITLSSQYGAIAGITQAELEESFAPEIAELKKDRPDILSQIKDWYHGYTWNMKTWVYNPFLLLNFMAEPVFHCYWFVTGTPTFLLRLLKERSLYDVEGIRLGSLTLSTFNADNPDPVTVLFQTGYLTVKSISQDGDVYELMYPNREVKVNLLDGLLSCYREIYPTDSVAVVADIKTALRTGDMAGLVQHLNSLIATIPYDHWNVGKESIFTVITYLTFTLAGIYVYTEVHSSRGRCDVLVKTDKYIYVMELKLDGTAREALAQIKSKGYLQPHLADSRKKLAVGIFFSSKTREVAEYLVEEQ